MPSPRVIHTAQALVDEIVGIDALPAVGGNAMAHTYQRYAGGAVTILSAAARNGAAAIHAGAHGTGPNGDLIRAVLAEERIALTSPQIRDRDTGICFVMVDASAQRTFVTTQGAERLITVDSLQTSAPVPGDFVCVSGYSLLDPTREPLLNWLASLPPQVRVVLDPGAAFAGFDARLQEEVLTRIAVWTSNADEARALTGVDGSLVALADAVRSRVRDDVVVIVRDGEHGCVVSAGDHREVVAGFPQRAVDTNGAGDTHTGIMLAARAAGASWSQACRRANAGAAIKVTRAGPITAPTADEIDGFLAKAVAS